GREILGIEEHALGVVSVVPHAPQALLARIGVDPDLQGKPKGVEELTVDLLEVTGLLELFDRDAADVVRHGLPPGDRAPTARDPDGSDLRPSYPGSPPGRPADRPRHRSRR